MNVNIQSLSNMTKKDVFTEKGVYTGEITDIGIDLERFKIKSIVVDAVKGSFLASLVGNKKGVVVPYSMVQAVGDVVIVKHISPSVIEEETSEEQPTND